jgi:hypothetical protein
MGSVVGGIATAKLATSGLIAYGAETATATVADAHDGLPIQGAWIRNGLISAGGDHEPYIYVVRRGGQRLDAHEHYEYEQSEALIRKLKDEGAEVFHTHLYKGLGMVAEKQGMEDAVRAAAIAHRLGMKVDNYVQWSTLMYETFFAEEPRAAGWVQCDQWGQPIMLQYGYQQSFRYRPCFSNQEYIDYFKKVVRYAVVEVKTDFIHFDNFIMNMEPDSCHCNGCKTGFRKFLKTKYSPQQRKERFGFENVDYVNPPLWNRWNPPDKLDVIFDPVFQEWIEFRCKVQADALGQMAALIRSLNTGVVIEINCGGLVGENNPWTRGNDFSQLLKHTQAFVSERDSPPGFQSDGRLITSIRTMKMARRYENVAIVTQTSSEIGLGERLAFNQTIVNLARSPRLKKYVSFYKKNRDLYVGTKDLAAVTVFWSHPSITYHNSRAGLTAILVQQALIQSRIPFHLSFGDDLSQLSPDTCKVLILPDSECLSDEEIEQIRRFVQTGGGLVATGHAGLYDQWRRLRITPGLEGLVDNQPMASAYEEEVAATTVLAGTPTQKQFGKGRVVYLPGIEFDGSMPPAEPYFHIGPEFWKRPKNWEQVVSAVSWVSQSGPLLQVSGPDFLVSNLVEQADKRRRIVHLVNYNSQVPSIEDIAVRCAIPEGTPASAVQLYCVDTDNVRSLDFHMDGQQAVFAVPKLNVYCMAVVTW